MGSGSVGEPGSQFRLWGMTDRPLLIERGEAVMRRERASYEKDKGKEKKRHQGGSGGQVDYQRPPKQLRQ